jgi:hypothetical protein
MVEIFRNFIGDLTILISLTEKQTIHGHSGSETLNRPKRRLPDGSAALREACRQKGTGP